jgi:hypothetical protein
VPDDQRLLPAERADQTDDVADRVEDGVSVDVVGWSLRPYPRWSGATTRKPASARGQNWWCQESGAYAA